MSTPKFFGREPAAWLALVAVLVKLAAAFGWDASPTVQAAVNGFAAAGMGVLIALVVKDGLGAAIVGFAQGALALALGLGLDWSSERQAVVMAFVTVAVGMWDRTQVTAPVPPSPARPTTP
ncbi:hypothetical protein [Streptomyces sp. DH12]|uniref:hypothetical protein n=1 Tax=Streptomyces sp. DH12 TaxID=2857010 RepID=UPI001E3FB4AD|nr:hypothetical protein [Streptomyces sp. DH12]